MKCAVLGMLVVVAIWSVEPTSVWAKNGAKAGSPSPKRTATAQKTQVQAMANQQAAVKQQAMAKQQVMAQQQAAAQRQASARAQNGKQYAASTGNGSGVKGQAVKQRDQKRDGSCLLGPTTLGTKDQIRQKDQLKKKDGSCLLTPTALGTKDQIRQKDQLKKKDGSCQ